LGILKVKGEIMAGHLPFFTEGQDIENISMEALEGLGARYFCDEEEREINSTEFVENMWVVINSFSHIRGYVAKRKSQEQEMRGYRDVSNGRREKWSPLPVGHAIPTEELDIGSI
jgi:hypothetical protein